MVFHNIYQSAAIWPFSILQDFRILEVKIVYFWLGNEKGALSMREGAQVLRQRMEIGSESIIQKRLRKGVGVIAQQ